MKDEPLTVRVKAADPATTEGGEMPEMAAAMTVKVDPAEVEPPGFCTVTVMGPEEAIWALLTVALMVEEVLPGRVVRVVPPNMITEPGRKFEPLTLRVKLDDPMVMEAGDRVEMAGAATVNGRAV